MLKPFITHAAATMGWAMNEGVDPDASRTARMCFGEFVLDLTDRRLSRRGERIELGSRYFDALALLAGSEGALVTKERFMDEVWRGVPVTDEALTQCIRTLRRALGDEAGNPRYIETVPKHGYRFLQPVDPENRSTEAPKPGSQFATGGRIAGAATFGGGFAGAFGGLFYGVLATQSGGSAVLVMVALVAALGVLGGAGVGIGMGLAAAARGFTMPMLAIGGAAGGGLVGALGQALGRDGIAALTGAAVGPVTGIFEGAVLGGAAGFACALAGSAGSRRMAAALASALGALAGSLLVLAGGRLLGRSFAMLQERFPASQIDIDRVGLLFGESGYYMISQLGSAALEGAAFIACVALAVRKTLRR